jgi:hypothetical protein
MHTESMPGGDQFSVDGGEDRVYSQGECLKARGPLPHPPPHIPHHSVRWGQQHLWIVLYLVCPAVAKNPADRRI